MQVQFKCISLLGLVQVVRKHQCHSIKLVHVPSNLLANANIKANHAISIVTFGSLWSVPLLSYFTAWVIARSRFNSLLVTLLRLRTKHFTMINSAWWLRTNSKFSRQEFKDIHLFCLQSVADLGGGMGAGMLPPQQPKTNDFGRKISLQFEKSVSISGCIPPTSLNLTISAEKSVSISVNTFFFFF